MSSDPVLSSYRGVNGPALRRRVETRATQDSRPRSLIALTPGAALYREGDPPGPAYLLVNGTLRVYRRSRRAAQDIEVLAKLGPGAIVGEMSPILKQPRSATVQALTRAEVLEMPMAQLRSLLQSHSSLQRVLILALQERAGLTADEITALAVREGVNFCA